MSDKPRPTRSTGSSRSARLLDSMRVIATGVTHREGGGASAVSNSISSISLAITALTNKLRGITQTVTPINVDSNLDIPIQIPGPRGLRGLTGTNGTIGVNGKPGRPGLDILYSESEIPVPTPGLRGATGTAGSRGRSGAQATPALDPHTDHDIAIPSPGLRGAAGAAGAASGSMVLISESILSADASIVTFSNIPQNFRHLKVVCYGRITGATVADYVGLRFNGDSGSNYDVIKLSGQGNGSFLGVTASNAGNLITIGNMPGSSSSRTTHAGNTDAIIPHYAGSTFDKVVHSTSYNAYTTANTSNNPLIQQLGGSWRNTVPVTQIDLYPGLGDFKAGCVFALYGIGTGTAASSVTPVWDTTVNEDGSSLSNWTQTSGSWSVASSAFHVSGSAGAVKALRYTARVAHSALVFQADVKMNSSGGFGADNRIGLGFNKPSNLSGGSIVTLRSTGALTPSSTGVIYTEQPDGTTAGPSSLTKLFNLDQYYTLKVVAIGNAMDVYVDGVYLYTLLRKMDPVAGAIEYAYISLYSYQCDVDFKNIKLYTPSLPNSSAVTLKLDDCANPDDNTDLNASTTAHGLLKKLDGTATNYMSGSGAWSDPITVANISSGTYNATGTGVTNITSLSPFSGSTYLRVGNICTVSGAIDINATAAGVIEFTLSLPFASALTSSTQCVGSFNANIYAGFVAADAASDKADFVGTVPSSGTHTAWYIFQYQII